MLDGYLKRGALAGVVGGAAYAAFMILVGNSLIGYVEHLEHGHGGGHAHAAGGESAVPELVTTGASAVVPVALGLLLGVVVFGVGYYFLEPLLPGGRDTKSYLLGAAGFVAFAGAPWVLLPPQPPGTEQGLPTDARVTWYAVMMVVGGAACVLSTYVYRSLESGHRRPVAVVGALVPFAAIPVAALVAPANPVTGPIPPQLAAAFRAVVAVGQLGLWFVAASTHAWLVRRATDAPTYRPAEHDEDEAFTITTE